MNCGVTDARCGSQPTQEIQPMKLFKNSTFQCYSCYGILKRSNLALTVNNTGLSYENYFQLFLLIVSLLSREANLLKNYSKT